MEEEYAEQAALVDVAFIESQPRLALSKSALACTPSPAAEPGDNLRDYSTAFIVNQLRTQVSQLRSYDGRAGQLNCSKPSLPLQPE